MMARILFNYNCHRKRLGLSNLMEAICERNIN